MTRYVKISLESRIGRRWNLISAHTTIIKPPKTILWDILFWSNEKWDFTKRKCEIYLLGCLLWVKSKTFLHQFLFVTLRVRWFAQILLFPSAMDQPTNACGCEDCHFHWPRDLCNDDLANSKWPKNCLFHFYV